MPRPKKRRPRPLKYKDARRLDAIVNLMEEDRWDEATRKARAFTARNPDVIEGWIVSMDLGVETESDFLIWNAARHLAALQPQEEANVYNAAVASAQLGIPFCTLFYLETYLERWPDGPGSQELRKLHQPTAELCQSLLEDFPLPPDADPAALRAFEEGQILVTYGHYKEGRQLSEQAARRLPGFPSPLNNLALSYAVEGNLERALTITQNVLADHPDNIHARSNAVQLLIRLGRAGEARPLLDSLREETPDAPDLWHKIMEAFVFAGDEQALIDLYQRADKALGRRKPDPMTRHLAAVAYARTGEPGKAEKLWKSALKDNPDLELARANLFDSKLPPGERNGPWYLPVTHWLPEGWIERLLRVFEGAGRRSEDEIRRRLERTFKALPGLETSLSLLLQAGDPLGVEVALNVAEYVPLPGLVEFALGQHGSDEDRMRASSFAVHHGLLEPGQPIEVFIKGKPRTVRSMGYEIYTEHSESDDLSDEALKCLEAATEALYDGQPERALEWVEQGLALAPDYPSLLNQKAVALNDLGHQEEAEAILRRNARLHPDYFFARCAMARLCAAEGKFDEAHDWLEPLLKQTRMHISEFSALAHAQADVLIQAGNMDAAISWVEMAEQVAPDTFPPLMSRFMRLRQREDLDRLSPEEKMEALLGPDALNRLKNLLDEAKAEEMEDGD